MTANDARLVEALRAALKETERLKDENQRLAARESDPVAIVGMACKFPGGIDSPEGLWELAEKEQEVLDSFPEDRGWDLERLLDFSAGRPGATYVRQGGFLREAAAFDAEFFSISPREAMGMDPQQRVVLELAWESLERAGIDPTSLAGEPVGVYVGAIPQEYGPRMDHADANVQGLLITGQTSSVMSGRISYVLGLEGPSVTIDTACSSSLVAIHQAMSSLRAGESSLALAGGVTIMSRPGMFTEFAAYQGLAGDSRCKPFAEGADGTAWAEGAGILVLERLSDARRNGHKVHAVIRGSAVNSDGSSNGLTAPNGPSQQRVIRQALENAGLQPDDVDVVEGHGTGTPLGDPIEAQALIATYGRDRHPDSPLRLGSFKSNIGHSQAAAGVGGVIKMVMAMRHGLMPRTLHVEEPSRHVDWSRGTVQLLTEAHEWPALAETRRRAAVSSFGISGTNAHIILEDVDDEGVSEALEADDTGEQITPWALSGASPTALSAQARRLADFVADRPGARVTEVARGLLEQRATLSHRAVVLAKTAPEFLDGLTALANAEEHPAVVSGQVTTGSRVFVFPGQGSQWVGMGSDLLDASSAFSEWIHACDEALAEEVDYSVVDVLRSAPNASGLERSDVVQPVLWAVMVSLAQWWRAHGVTPDAVVGHSQGEIAAAYVAGVLSLQDAARIVARRGRLAHELAGSGALGSIALPEHRVRDLIAPWGDRLHVAVVNSSAATVIAGDSDAVNAVVTQCAENGAQARLVDADYASHSPHVDPLRPRVLEELSGIEPGNPTIPLYSTVTAGPLNEPMDAEYWFRNLRQPVRFKETLEALGRDGHRAFVECSPHPILTAAIRDTLETGESTIATVASMRRDTPGPEQMVRALAEAHTAGMGARLTDSLPPSEATVRPDLPTYAFQRQRFWLEGKDASPGRSNDEWTHPILDRRIDLADGGVLLTGGLSVSDQPWLAHHAVRGRVLFPATGFVELVLAPSSGLDASHLDELLLEDPLALSPGASVDVQVSLDPPDHAGHRGVAVYSKPSESRDGWRRHAHGVLRGADVRDPSPQSAWPPLGAEPVEVGHGYETLAAAGYEYGPAFQGLTRAWRRGTEVFAEVTLPEEVSDTAADYVVHPALLDAGLHAYFLLNPSLVERRVLPFAWQGHTQFAVRPSALRVRIAPGEDATLNVLAWDSSGDPVLTVTGLTLRELPDETPATGTDVSDSLFHITWTPVTGPETDQTRVSTAVIGNEPLGVPGCTQHRDWETFAATLEATDPPSVVFVGFPERSGDDIARESHTDTAEALQLVQRWMEDPRLDESLLVFVTRKTQAVLPGDGVTAFGQASVTGLIRTAQTEYPGRFVLLDVAGEITASDITRVWRADEPQLALRSGVLFAPRLARVAQSPALVPPDTGDAWRLDTTAPGTVDSLELIAAPETEAPLEPTQVRVGVRAAGLNFRDVLLSLGMYPGEGVMGSEGAGVVLEVGDDVADFVPGDRVMGRFDRAFAPKAIADQREIARMPQGWTFAQGAAVPAVFLTAYQSLVTLGALRRGESVLVHAATGGVGSAAVQLAQHLGAEVFATAHPDKWGTLRAMGLDDAHIASSRTAEFEDKFRHATAGRGVNVVLNSLAGELLDASLRLTADGGRFVEIGKTDPRETEVLDAEHPGLRYLPLDLITNSADQTATMLRALMELFGSGELVPPKITTWDLRRAPDAFRHLREARHVGKIVLTQAPSLNQDGTVLITGGTGTLGSLVARHLVVEHGARHLLLASRSGSDSPGALALRKELSELGADATVAACDVSDPADLDKLFAEIPPDRPLTAVIHTAGTLDDTTLAGMTHHHLGRVFAPKLDAALALDRLTRDQDLSAFVLYSSAVGTIGNAGQGNYAAANTAMDALAQHRASRGLPATSIAWGFWAESTGLTKDLNSSDLARMERVGFREIPTERGLALFDAALSSGHSVAVASDLDTERGSTESPLLRDLRPQRPRAAHNPQDAGEGAVESLRRMSEADRDAELLRIVRGNAAHVLGLPSAQSVPIDRPFKELGFDSLTSVELRNRLGSAVGLRLPATLLFDYPTPLAVRDFVRGEMGVTDPETSESATHESDKIELHRALDAIPAQRLRESGLTELVLAVARGESIPAVAEPASAMDLDSLDADDLVRLALEEDTSSADTTGG